LVQPYNDIDALSRCFDEWGKDIACVIIEPIAGNMNMVIPDTAFIDGLQHLCDRYDSLLIFDEVMTGFRVAAGGAQGCWGIKPDLTTLGKVIGGGMPVGAFGGRHDVMQHLAPAGPVYQAGTLSGNPVAMSAGIATLEKIAVPGFYDDLQQKTERLTTGLQEAASSAGEPISTTCLGGMFGFAFTKQQPLKNFADVQSQDTTKFQRFFGAMLDAGVYLAPSCFEAGFVSTAHTDDDIDATIAAASGALEKLA
ncbi:MAG: aminotransferase class III-fold pyridoxal phosphate-dependent enzyme, partial [Pseudomonadota bacterium]